MDPVTLLEHVAKGSPALLLVPAAAVGPASAPIVVAGAVDGTVLGYPVLTAAVRRMAEEPDPVPGAKVDGSPANVADSVPC